MRYFLSKYAVLKWLETPTVYHIKKDGLYELDDESFEFLKHCASDSGCAAEDNDFIRYCTDEDILTYENPFIRRPPLIKSPRPSLRYLELQITNRCNIRCKHCYIDGAAAEELPLGAVRKILSEFDEMQGLRVLITGGEPLIYSRFDDLNAMLPDFSIRKILFSNGLLLKKEGLTHLNFDEIQISIDGLEEAHDAIRGKGTFKISMKAIKDALDAGFDVSVSTMVHPGNLNDFDEMERLFKDMGIKDWTVDVPCFTGRLEHNKNFQTSPEIGGKFLKYGFGDGLHTTDTGYGCGLNLMAVISNGKVAKCTFYEDSAVGTIDEGLRTCRQRIRPVELKELNCDCAYLESCRGGCRYRAELSGDIHGKDLHRCALYDVLKAPNVKHCR
jgi:radical SAM protein with 4Fe4S-binding SPASM domain